MSLSQETSRPPANPPLPAIKPFLPERILFCLDVSEEMLDEDLSRGTGGVLNTSRKLTRLEHLKQALKVFIITKQRMSHLHEFAVAALTHETLWLSDFSSDGEVAIKAINSLKAMEAFSTYDMSSVFTTIRDRFSIFSSRGEWSHLRKDRDEFVYRVMFIYGRSNVLPSFPIPSSSSTPLHTKLLSNQLLFFDALYLHQKPSIPSRAQEIYDFITEIDEQERCYFFETSTSLKRLKSHLGILLANPLQRPSQASFVSALVDAD